MEKWWVAVRQRWSGSRGEAGARMHACTHARTRFSRLPAGGSEMSRNASRWQSPSAKWERVQCENLPPPLLPSPPRNITDAARWTPTRRCIRSAAPGPKTVIKNRGGRRDAQALVQRLGCASRASRSRPASRPSFRLVALKAMHSIWTGLKASLLGHSGESLRVAPAALPAGERCVCVPPSQRASE